MAVATTKNQKARVMFIGIFSLNQKEQVIKHKTIEHPASLDIF